jgi:uncharacterized membrane protein YfcA
MQKAEPLKTADILVLVLGLAFAWELAQHQNFSLLTLLFAVALSLLAFYAVIRRFSATRARFQAKRHDTTPR